MNETVHASTKSQAPEWVIATISVFFALFYVYSMWVAVSNLVSLNLFAMGLDTNLSPFGWVLLSLGVLMPIAIYGIAFRLGRDRNIGVRSVLFLTGLAVVSIFAIDTFMFSQGGFLA